MRCKYHSTSQAYPHTQKWQLYCTPYKYTYHYCDLCTNYSSYNSATAALPFHKNKTRTVSYKTTKSGLFHNVAIRMHADSPSPHLLHPGHPLHLSKVPHPCSTHVPCYHQHDRLRQAEKKNKNHKEQSYYSTSAFRHTIQKVCSFTHIKAALPVIHRMNH